MIVSGLNNYAFIGNDNWIKIIPTNANADFVNITATNLLTNKVISVILYPINNEFNFNVIRLVKALYQPFMWNKNNLFESASNNIQNYRFDFTITYNNQNTEAQTLENYFIRGFANSLDVNNSFFTLYDSPVFGIASPDYKGYLDDFYNDYANFFEEEKFTIQNLVNNGRIRDEKNYKQFCNHATICFLNSMGGVQFFIFDSYEIKTNSKPTKIVERKQSNFLDAGFYNIGTEINSEIELFSDSSSTENEIIKDLICSSHVLYLNPKTNQWIDLILNSNVNIENANKKRFSNKVKYDFYLNINNSVVW